MIILRKSINILTSNFYRKKTSPDVHTDVARIQTKKQHPQRSHFPATVPHGPPRGRCSHAKDDPRPRNLTSWKHTASAHMVSLLLLLSREREGFSYSAETRSVPFTAISRVPRMGPGNLHVLCTLHAHSLIFTHSPKGGVVPNNRISLFAGL